ncbi:unnamed protein product [Arabis nemorensis]|uniref:F-box domain-containing protein n=1 Tax=Arabis nemorensis TaxID=586526 RepID=A0A565BZ58_9BRAS|nr:unnamed protein product [Arabis nemorensis]
MVRIIKRRDTVLPEDLIIHIVSFLSAKEAARTRVLYKQWLNLFTIESDLVFDYSVKICGSFKSFVDRLLARHVSYRVRRLSLKLRPTNFDSAQYKLVNECLCNVLKRGVMDLELDINVDKDYPLPSEVFTCSTVVKLKLGSGFVIDIIPKDASLPALKTLILDSVQFYSLGDGCVFQRLISACPVLEELVIDGHNCEDWNWSGTVSSQILNRLTIRRKDRVQQDGSSYVAISFDTPSLEYLEYSDLLRDEYPVVNLNSLVEAKLNLPVWHAPESYNPGNLVIGLKNVQIMSLDYVETMQLFDAVYQVIPKFGNMCHLSISTEPDYCCYGLEILVKNSPNLKTLTIKPLLKGLNELTSYYCKRETS